MTNKIAKLTMAALLGVSLAACTEGPDNPRTDTSKYILFSAPELDFSFADEPFSRAQLVDQIDEFTVWGYCIPNDVSGNKSKSQAREAWASKSEFFTTGPDVLNGFKVTVNGGSTSYDKDNANGTASNPKEWYSGNDHPLADDYNYGFIAASAKSGKFTMNYTAQAEKAHPKLTFELPYTSTNVSTELDPADQPDVLIGTKFDQFNNGKVSLKFQHLMTGLQFRFHNQCTPTADDPKDLIINRVTFEGEFYKKIIVSFPTEDIDSWVTEFDGNGDAITPSTYAGTFVMLNQDQTIKAGTSALVSHPDGTPVKLLLLPNAHATFEESQIKIDDWALGRQKKITVEYTISGRKRTYTTDDDFRLMYIPDPNTLHTANFHFVGDDFVLTFTPDNQSMWENGSDNNFDIH